MEANLCHQEKVSMTTELDPLRPGLGFQKGYKVVTSFFYLELCLPKTQLDKNNSSQFVKRFLALSLSQIIFLRELLPPHAFAEYFLEDLPVKMLDKQSKMSEVGFLLEALESSFKAIEKKYLQQLIFMIVASPECEKVIESYTFTFGYDQDEATCKLPGGKEIHNSTRELIKALPVVTNSLEPVPEDAHMTLRLFYYDEATPEEYEPDGFEECSHLQTTFVKEPPVKIDMGKIKTPYHNFKLKITSSQEYTQPTSKQYKRKYNKTENKKERIKKPLRLTCKKKLFCPNKVQFYQLSPTSSKKEKRAALLPSSGHNFIDQGC